MMKYLIYITLFFTGLNALQAGIITVAQNGSGDVTSVQEGINLAQANDTVLVMPGTYYENLIIEGKALTLASNYLFTNNPEDIHNTTLDGDNENTVIKLQQVFDYFELHGFTVQHGHNRLHFGGGVNIEECTNTHIINCDIRDNFSRSGGGIRIDDSETFFAGTTIRYNHAYDDGGGIVMLYDSKVHFSEEFRCNIYMNYAPDGADILKTYTVEPVTLYADTLTVMNPSIFYVLSRDNYGNPLDEIEINQLNAKIEEVDNDVYISPSGNNANDGITPESPYKNIWYAMMKVKSNPENPHTVYLLPGTYSPSVNQELFPVHCKPNSKIIGQSLNSVLLDAEQITSLMEAGKEHKFVHLENLEMINGSGENGFGGGVYLSGLDSVFIQNIHIHHLSDANFGLDIHITGNSIVNNVKINFLNGDRAMSITNWEENTQNKSFIKNLNINNNGPGADLTGGGMRLSGIFPLINSINATIVNASFTHNYNNETFWPNIGSAIAVSHFVSLKLVNATFANNTAHDGGAIAINATDGPSDIQVYNSIFSNNSPEQISIVGEPSTLKLYHCNLEGGMDDIDIVGDHTVGIDDGTIDIDPVFTTYNGTDYFLADNSPCINTGTMDLGGDFQWPPTDLMGNPRLHGIVDMGAYENPFVPVSISNHTPEKTTVSPNPGNERIILTINKNDFTFRLYDQTGQEVLESSGKKIINTGTLPQGMYYYRITSNQQILSSGKWVKQ